MNGATCSVLDDYAPKRKPQLPELRRTLPRWARRLVFSFAAALALLVIVQVMRGRNHEYARVVAENKALSAMLGTCQGAADRKVSTPNGMYFFGTLGAFDLFAREKAPARVASR